MTTLQKELVIEYANSDMNMHEVARKKYRSRGNIYYHLSKVHEETGLNPLDKEQLKKLVQLIKEEKNGKVSRTNN